MKVRTAIGALALTIAVAASGIAQEKTVMVGGAAMYPSKDIIDNAVNSKDHTTLVTAVKAAGLVDTLKGAGSIHGVCADQRGLRQAASRHGGHAAQGRSQEDAHGILTYHVVAGRHDSADAHAQSQDDERQGRVKTVRAGRSGSCGRTARSGSRTTRATAAISIADVYQSNGVIHVIDTVMMPN